MDEPDETLFIVARDGTRLGTDVYLPRRTGRVPAVLARTPYGKASNPVWFPAIGRLFAENGLAFVAQDTRGHNSSAGDLAPFDEAHDGWDTLGWITEQPWSDGTTAVFGESYVGFAAAAAAATGHPSVRAVALRNTTTDLRGDWLRHQGVLRLEFVVRWALAAWAGRENLAPEIDFSRRPMSRIARSIGRQLDAGDAAGYLDSWAVDEARALCGGETPWPALIDQVRTPVHLTTGWWDLFLRGATRDWSRLASHPGVDRRFVAEATDHAGREWLDGPTPDPLADFDELATRLPDILSSEVAFLRKHLLGIDDGRLAAASWMLTHVGMRQSATWPPPGVEPLVLHLVDGGQARRGPEGGGLSRRPDRLPVEARWEHDPTNLVPALEGEAVDGWFRRPDERQTQVRDDVLTFTSGAVEDPLDLAGPSVAALAIRAPRAGGHVMAKLCDVDPDGQAHRISEGTFLLAPGAEAKMAAVQLGHTGYRVRPGHRLRLEVSSSAFPRYIAHPGTSEDPWNARRVRPAEITLLTGPAGSTLTLSTLRVPDPAET